MHLKFQPNPGVWPWTVWGNFCFGNLTIFSNWLQTSFFLLGPTFCCQLFGQNSDCHYNSGSEPGRKAKGPSWPGPSNQRETARRWAALKEASTKAFGLFRMAISIWCSSRAGANALPVAFWRKPRTFYESLRIIQRSLVKVMEWLFFVFEMRQEGEDWFFSKSTL